MPYLGLTLMILFAPLLRAEAPVNPTGEAPAAVQEKSTTPPLTPDVIPTPRPQAPPVTTPTFADRPNINPSLEDDVLSYKDAFLAFIKTILMLLVVLAFAYILLGKGLPKLMSRTTQGHRMRIIERLPLDQKRSVFLVKVDDTTYLLGGSDQNLQLIDTLSKDSPDFKTALEIKKSANDALKEVS